jgi:hypothetical protein
MTSNFSSSAAAAIWPKPRLFMLLYNTQLDTHTHTHTLGLLGTSNQLVAEVIIYKTHYKNKRRTTTPLAVFETTIPTVELPQTVAFDSTSAGIGGFLLI